MESKDKYVDGSEDVKVFVEKVSLHSALKGYDGEKAAQNLASKVEGRAFDICMRLSSEDRKNPEKLKSKLLKEFETGNADREEAIVVLGNRKRHPDESPQTFAYKVTELVHLAYPLFEENTAKAIAKDYFVRGLHPKMQIALQSLASFAGADIYDLAKETTGRYGTMSPKSLGAFPVICAIDEVQNSLPLKTMLFKRHMTSIIGISDTFPNS